MCENCDAESVGTYPLPPKDDPHGWTVGFQIEVGGSSIYRTIGWVGDYRHAEETAMIAAMFFSPLLSFGAVPAPRSDEPAQLMGVTERPPLMPADYELDPHAATAVPAEYLAGAEVMPVVDAMSPFPVMMAARVAEMLREKDVDVKAFFNDGKARVSDLDGILGREALEQLKSEFSKETVTLGVAPEDLPCICGRCNKPGQPERP